MPKGIYKKSETHKIKLSEIHKGMKHLEETKIKIGLANKGKLRTEEYKDNLRRARLGKRRPDLLGNKNPNWKGGIMPLTKQIRCHFKYRQWRSDIFTRDDFICQKCGTKGGKLHAHHIKHFAEIIEEYKIKILEEALNCEELWNINNGITLCRKCHKNPIKGFNKAR